MMARHYISCRLWLAPGDGNDRCFPLQLLQRKADAASSCGKWELARAILADCHAFAGGNGLGPERAEAGLSLGVVLRKLGDYERAEQVLTEAESSFRDLGRLEQAALALTDIANIQYMRGRFDDALALYRRSLGLCDSDAVAMAAVGNMGSTLLHQGQYDQARDCFQRTIAIAERNGDRRRLAIAFGNLGILHDELADYGLALDCYQQQMRIGREIGDPELCAVSTGNIGKVRNDLGDHLQALDCYRQYLAITERIGDRKSASIAWGNIGLVSRQMERWDEAEEALRRAIAIGSELGVNFFLCSYHLFYGDLCLARRRHGDADRQLSQAAALAEAAGRGDVAFKARLLQARLAGQRDPAAGIALLDPMMEQYPDDDHRADIHYELHLLGGDGGHRRQAQELYRRLYQRRPMREYQQRLRQLEQPRPEKPTA